MAPLDVSKARAIDSVEVFDRLLGEQRLDERELVVAVYKKASGRQTVSFEALLEAAMSHGWVDTQTRRIDDDRYAIRYMRRRPGSNWSRNREIARRLIAEGRMKPTGRAVLPPDL
jgi:uncharacterized protein YdeI (YjbR/CyaY-like superfamily)